MRIMRRIDENGFFIEDVIEYDEYNIPSDLIKVKVPQGFHNPKWDGTKWIEGKPQEEIDAGYAYQTESKEWLDYIQAENDDKKAQWLALGKPKYRNKDK